MAKVNALKVGRSVLVVFYSRGGIFRIMREEGIRFSGKIDFPLACSLLC